MVPLSATEQDEALTAAIHALDRRFQGVFGPETITECVHDSYASLAATATVTAWLPMLAERLASDRLTAAARTANPCLPDIPSVLFLCVHNAGRSQIALGYFRDLAGDRAIAWSAGSDPGPQINLTVAQAMAEAGIDIATEYPKPNTPEILAAADVVVTMGCGDACPVLPGKRYLDWDIPDPQGATLDQVRAIRDQIAGNVQTLLDSLLRPTP
jgi:arsenate reductase (thioredoxin)